MTAGLAAYLESLQEGGRFPSQIHPVVFLSMIIGPIHFWFRYQSRYAAALELKETDQELDQMFLKQFSRILTGFFENPELWDRLEDPEA